MSGKQGTAPIIPIDRLDDQFIVRHATIEDFGPVLKIYNQSIAGKQATANLTPVTTEERAAWFDEHLTNPLRPIYVVKAIEPLNAGSEQDKTDSLIVAWGSYSDLYERTAYHISSEISIYLHQDYHAQGLGSKLLQWMLYRAPSLGIQNVVALVFAHNQPSLKLFRKVGFEQWGYLPKVCDMQGFVADVVMLGKAIPSNSKDTI